MSIPTHKRSIPVTLDRALVSRLDRIAKGCRLHRSSVLSGLIAEGLEALEARYGHAPNDLRSELGAAVYALRLEIARQRMWELFQKTQCSTTEARERSVVEARRQAEREVGLPRGTLNRPKPAARSHRDRRDQDAGQTSFPPPPSPVTTNGASNTQHQVGAEDQGGDGERGGIDARGPLPVDPAPVRGRRSGAGRSDPHLEGDSPKSGLKAARTRHVRKRRRGSPRTALPRARRAYELRMLMGMGWDEIAREVGYSPENGGQSAKEMAKRYALRHGHRWPVC